MSPTLGRAMSRVTDSRPPMLALVLLSAAALLAGCGSGSTAVKDLPLRLPGSRLGPGLAPWSVWRREQRPLDLAGPLSGGSFVLAAHGRLYTLNASGRSRLFSAAYHRPGNAEPYIAVPAPGHRGCSFGTDTLYVLRLYGGRGVVAVSRRGPVRRFATITAPGLIDGITFDEAGRFGHRLLVTITNGAHTAVQAVDCRGRVRTITRTAPRVEGGIVVATAPFGRFAGDLIAPDEKSGRILAIGADGRSRLVAVSGLSSGQDIGVESEVQLPPDGRFAALLGADRLNPGNRHPGDDAILRVSARALRGFGTRAGDLMVGTEGGARLLDVHCNCRDDLPGARGRRGAKPRAPRGASRAGAGLGETRSGQLPNPTRLASVSTST